MSCSTQAREARGSYFLEPAVSNQVRLPGAEVVVFLTGPARVELPDGRRELADPLTAVHGASGGTSRWTVLGRDRIRLDWHLLETLRAELGPLVFEPSPGVDRHRFDLHYSSPRLFLGQRLLARAGGRPRALVGGPWKLHPLGGGSEAVRSVRHILATRFTESDSVPAIARAAGSSKAHLSRLFKRETGLSIVSYRHQLRLRSALDALDRPTVDLMDLALDLGYASHSHFTAWFGATFGLTPSRYRQLARKT